MRKIIPIALLLICPLAMAAGDVYRWKDANGVPHYSDQPQPGAELIRANKRPVNSSPQPATPASATAAPAAADAPAPVSREVAQQVRQDAATIKADQCKKATDAYQKTIESRRIYKTDEKGNRTYLSSSEIDAARMEARATRDLTCNPASP